MHYYEVAPNRIIRAGSSVFTYASKDKLVAGQIVLVEVGKKHNIGVIMRAATKPAYSTKPIITVIERSPVPAELLKTAEWMSAYYATPLATVLQLLLPAGLQKKRRLQPESPALSITERATIVLNRDQRVAVQRITDAPPTTFLLHGVTGSGKTAVYLELARQSIKSGKSILILVPEIALTSQLVSIVTREFSHVIVSHSNQTEAVRHRTWNRVLGSDEPYVIIGPRSTLFLPLRKIGLIVVDEAHEPSFKQEQSPRYSALRVASVLGSHHKATVIFGSATPSITDYFIASKSNRVVALPKSARKDSAPPSVSLVDMTKRINFKQHRFLSDKLLEKISETLEANKQVLLFHNRRGSASTTLCEQCGWTAQCPRCFIPYSLHVDTHELRCHTCGLAEHVPTQCPLCQSVHIIHKGYGTKLIEAEIRKLFPNKNIVRFDGDSSSDETLEKQYDKIHSGHINILIGTQIVAKGLDLPNLRTVGVIQADSGLALPDFFSAERTFQLLAQVIGRVGRSHHKTDVIIQTFQPAHPVITSGISQDYNEFYKASLALRKSGNFPPFTFLLKLTNSYKTERVAIKNARNLAEKLRLNLPNSVSILGPTPAFYERQRDTYRWQLVLKSPSRQALIQALQFLPPSHWQFELDPTSLLS
jgi:primosomal protein N' (replication factor Y) (superfamily II helicase)